MFDEAPDHGRIIVSAQLGAIHDEVKAMPMGYETPVWDMGSAFSGGQKARVLLARAPYRQPKLLLLDEGPAHLDPATEAIVNQAITALGITRIVIAHRAETVRYATRVLVKLIEICFLRRSSRVECLRPAGGRRGNHSIASGSGRRHQGFSRTVACFVSVEVAGAKKLETKQGWF